MQKKHEIFTIQMAIAIIAFVLSSLLVLNLFHKAPKAQEYLSFNEGVKKMASSSTALIDSLIIDNDLTFDPSSGKLIDKVLKNLKYTENNKFLIIGSSQMRAVQGKGIDGYVYMVSRRMNNYLKNKEQVYNLSLGGMKTPEKLIMAKKSVEILQPQRILISVTPWDCLANEVRPSVKAIENKKYYISNKRKHIEKPTSSSLMADKVFPLNVNDEISNSSNKFVEDNIEIYSNRSAIKKWLRNKVTGTLKGIKSDNVKEKEEDSFKTNIPEYWRTLNQDFDNISGWDKENSREGTKSIKIRNTISRNSKWLGDNITLNRPTKTFEFEGWSKAQNVSSDTKLYCLDFQVIFEDGTSQWYFKGLKFGKGTFDWKKVSTKVRFDKKVVTIKPHMLFYGGTGTVWFDAIKACPIYEEKTEENILPNSSFEIELKERQNVSYSYTITEWDLIKKNMFSIVDFLSIYKKEGVLLMTPFWHNETKSAYTQNTQYSKLVEAVKDYCKEKNVFFIDASYILSKDNFGVYTKGSVRDKIDVLHFNAEGHDKLAKYIIKELKL